MKIDCCNPLNVLFNIVFLALICRRFIRYGPSYTQSCRALTLTLARVSSIRSVSKQVRPTSTALIWRVISDQ